MIKDDYHEVDIFYNLVTYVNTSDTQDMYYNICYQILQNIEKIPDININELADLCYTSPATISRFCKALKCENFQQLKQQVKDGLKAAKHEIHLQPKDMYEYQCYPEKCIDMIYDQSIAALIQSKKSINISDLDYLCDIIHKAKKIHFFGFQFNKILASDIQLKLLKLGKFAYAFSDRGDDRQRLELLSQESLAIVISARARNIPIASLIENIKAKGAEVVLITLNAQAKAIDLCDKAFVIDAFENTCMESSTSGTTAIKTYLDLVYFRYGILYPRR